jgi:DNA modification methylase
MSPYFTCEQGALYQGDCLEVMKQFPEGSIDFVLTDPPYGTTHCKWDNVLPFEPMWGQVHRLIKNNGAIVLFGSEPFSSALRMSNIKKYKYDWVWEKPHTGQLNAKKRPLSNIENILVFSVEKTVYFPQFRYDKPYVVTSKGCKGSECYGKQVDHTTVSDGKRYPKQILSFVHDKNREHPTQKPVALMEYLIKTYTLEGETVLDFTIGSGTTAVACVNTNRKFIGIEQDEKYIEIAKKRVMDAILAKTEDLENL